MVQKFARVIYLLMEVDKKNNGKASIKFKVWGKKFRKFVRSL